MDLEQVALSTSVEVRLSLDTQFIERLKKGDAVAFETLVAERSGEIYGLLYRLTENAEEARDLTQETFLRAFQNIGHFRGDADLRTWIYRIAINQARNRWRWWRDCHEFPRFEIRRPWYSCVDSAAQPLNGELCVASTATVSLDPVLLRKRSDCGRLLRCDPALG